MVATTKFRALIAIAVGAVLYTSLAGAVSTEKASALGNVAFYYGNQPPVPELQAFDRVVVDADSNISPRNLSSRTKWMAYLSVGEVEPNRSYAKSIPREWLIGRNNAWDSSVIDQAAPGWPAFFVKNVVAPLWVRGFRGFFLDTLDSYQLVAKTPEALEKQRAGLIAVVREIKSAYPDAELIFNRGFEILPEVGQFASAVAFESLYRGWSQAQKQYVEVSESDRKWLLDRAKTVRDVYHLPVIAIDYCAPADTACKQSTVEKISAQNIIPYVADGGLQTVGQGVIKVVPRRILVVQNRAPNVNIDNSEGVRFLSTPLNYLGYKVEFVDVKEALPEAVSSDIYAGIVIWFNGSIGSATPAFSDWMRERIKAGVPVAFMNQFGVPVDGVLGRQLGLQAVQGRLQGKLEVTTRDPMMGFEMMPSINAANIVPVRSGKDSAPLLTLSAGNYTVDAAAITPWGGYAMSPYAVVTLDEIDQTRWAIQPIEFFRRALRLNLLPVPDTTTENGKRLLMTHIDGDGFASRIEFFAGGRGPGFPGDVLYKEIFTHYKIPTTMSVIEGETGQKGLYPQLSKELEAIAKKIFALPNVEVATHTYSHPYEWDDAVRFTEIKEGRATGPLPKDFHLPIPGYVYNNDREINGSINYINNELTKPNKPVKMVLWPGSCDPPAEAVRMAYAAGVLNMNGGDTLITKSRPSWTEIGSLGINKGPGAFQVFAPNQNENIYTNDWLGPFYGFERVIETFQMTDTPYRFKPVDIYYHSYSATKLASLKGLKKVYDYALSQPNFPIYSTEYVRKVLDFENMSVATEGDEWIVRGAGDLRTVRIPEGDAPLTKQASGVVGYTAGPGGTYVHLAGDMARFRVGKNDDGRAPYVASANGRISDVTQESGRLMFNFQSHVKPQLALARASNCAVTVNGKQARAITKGKITDIGFIGDAASGSVARIEVRCGS
ncbi:MAG TPA: bifunctional glycoside hydrolase 114/ polysaccharide deacetylase family protein [Oxalicibacterium sp.]|uniref:bifunctional glycoside hydrolase 114/ polysaccharide deacetylase family protein n=1 Tax=Oxalicibacterium sp. TaxID=2766525 RepID=UPI002D168BB8|nr:bifunctional glycoside hydrolase 114/ polysaccharide deacetylase family protein [Oxalicibacterium sp.]HWU97781.1 bifunctional glycoside hydrolase 114/ polysaccharide deacetylase family protein [Oxalicibacterium sp.]